MKYRRYGKFRLKNHVSNCCMYLLFAGIGIVGITMGDAMISDILFICIPMVDAIVTLIPYREKFLVNQTSLLLYKGRTTEEKFFPAKMTVVLSYADMCTDLAKRVSLVNQTYMLKGEWAISLLEDVSVNKVIEKLHGKGAWRYTNCWVEELLSSHFIYSFVCNQSVLEEVLSDKNYTLIIPESLLHKIDIQKIKGEIYIDKGF